MGAQASSFHRNARNQWRKRVGFMLEKLLEEGQAKPAKPKDLPGSGGSSMVSSSQPQWKHIFSWGAGSGTDLQLGKLPMALYFIQPLWRVLSLFNPWEGLGFTEQETLSSSCGWKLGHALILHPNTPQQNRELRPAFLITRPSFSLWIHAKDHEDKKNPQANVYP